MKCLEQPVSAMEFEVGTGTMVDRLHDNSGGL
jgi:hypothetical protein